MLVDLLRSCLVSLAGTWLMVWHMISYQLRSGSELLFT
jgi:hypothetical protein